MASAPSLGQLEEKIRDISLDADPDAMRQAGYRVVDWIVARIEGIRQSTLGHELSREEAEKLLREDLPEDPAGFDRVFDEFREKVAPNAIQLDHPRFFAFIPSAPNYVSVWAEALVAGSNYFAGTWLESSGPSQVELVVVDWFKKILEMPTAAAGLLVSGGSVANLTALAAARRSVLNDHVQDAVVYLSDQTHASVDRALRLLGFASPQFRRIPTDAEYRMDTEALRGAIEQDLKSGLKPFAVIASGGTTNTGAVDPLKEVAAITREYSMWFHVDAAYGGFAALTERGRKLLEGIGLADSVVLDPHKWLYCPFEAGCVLVRDSRLLRDTFRIMPEYMHDVAREDHEVNFCDYGLQLTRSFRALKVWMAIKTFGARRFREVIDQSMDLAEYASRLIELSPRLALLTRPQLGVFAFRYVPENLPANAAQAESLLERVNQKLQARILSDRQVMISSTRLEGRFVLRFCVLNHRTRKEDVRESVNRIEEMGRSVEDCFDEPSTH